MDYWFKSYDENAYFYAISGTVTPKCIAGVVVSETQGAPRLIADGDVRNEMAATWVAYRRQENYPDYPWGSGTVNQFWYNSTYDVTWAQIPQTLNRQPYSSNVHLITDISIELVLSKAREYFDHYVPGQGVGVVTLQTERPSQLLTFTSQKLGQSFKYWIRGNQTIKLYTPGEEPSELIIFRNGAFTDAVKDGFDIANYKFHNGGDVYSDVSEYLFTNWGIIDRENAYVSINQYIISDGCIKYYGSVTSSSAWTNYFIPIKPLPGNAYDKIRFEAALLNVSAGDAYDIIKCTAMTFDRAAYTRIYPNGGDSGNIGRYTSATFEEFGNVISGLSSIDYIAIAGCNGTPAWKNIKLIKDSVNVSERPRNVIFENGQWGPGVTTDFDYQNAADYKVLGNDWSINTYTFSRYILFNHDTYYQADTYLISVSDNCFYRPASTSSTSYLFGQYKIPLKRATGYTKISFDAKLTDASNLGSNLLCARGVYVNSNDRSMSYGQNQIYYQNATSYTDWTHFELDISDMPYIDYLQIEVDRGCVKYRNVIMT